MPLTILVTAGELAARLADPYLLVVDCRAELSDRDAGARAWRVGHIPGAIHAELERDLSAPVTPTTGRHPLPSIEDFEATLSRWGVTGAKQVIAYDAGNSAYAARLWWMLRYAGHDAVAVLDGGYAAWL
ncbi:MAG: sulfurtransferase, partial [Steroidobacteraceae bacterium]